MVGVMTVLLHSPIIFASLARTWICVIVSGVFPRSYVVLVRRMYCRSGRVFEILVAWLGIYLGWGSDNLYHK